MRHRMPDETRSCGTGFPHTQPNRRRPLVFPPESRQFALSDYPIAPTPMIRSLLSVALLLALASGSSSLRAQSLFGGIHYSGAALDLKGASKQVDFGGGYGVHAGLGLGSGLQVVVNYDRNSLTGSGTSASADIAQFDALARYFLLSSSAIRVFATGGVTGRTVKMGESFEGVSATGGGGLMLKALPRIALTGTALWTFGNLTSAKQLQNRTGNEFQSTGVRVQVGASFFLLGR